MLSATLANSRLYSPVLCHTYKFKPDLYAETRDGDGRLHRTMARRPEGQGQDARRALRTGRRLSRPRDPGCPVRPEDLDVPLYLRKTYPQKTSYPRKTSLPNRLRQLPDHEACGGPPSGKRVPP